MPNWGTTTPNGNVNRRFNWSKGTAGVIKDAAESARNKQLPDADEHNKTETIVKLQFERSRQSLHSHYCH